MDIYAGTAAETLIEIKKPNTLLYFAINIESYDITVHFIKYIPGITNTKENQETIEPNKDKNKDNNKIKKDKNDDKKKNMLNINSKKKITDKDMQRFNTEDNKDALSNVLTEGVMTNDGHKISMQKKNFNGITLMKGIEECFSEDLDEDEVLQLVEDALGENIIDDKREQIPGTITSDQAKAIASILYKKINKNNDEDEKSGDIDLKKYPELKGVNIKIGVTDFTRDVIKNIMFSGQKVEDCQIDLTYKNLTKDNDNLKALSIQIVP